MAKLVWRVLTHSGEVRCKVLCAKYGLKAEDGANLRRKQRSPEVWRGADWGAGHATKRLKVDGGEWKGSKILE